MNRLPSIETWGRVRYSLLLEDGLGFQNPVRLNRHPHHIARTEGDIPVGDEQQLFSVRHPVRLRMHIPRAEVIPVFAEAVVARERDLFAGPSAVTDRAHIDVENPFGLLER